MTPKTFTTLAGASAFIAGLIFLLLPHSVLGYDASDEVTSVNCGNGFTGLSDEPARAEAGAKLTAVLTRQVTARHLVDQHIVDDCKEQVRTAQYVGWPLAAFGAVGLSAGLLVRWPTKPAGTH